MLKKIVKYCLLLTLLINFTKLTADKNTIDKKTEQSALDSLYAATVLLTNTYAIYNLPNFGKANTIINDVIKSFSPFSHQAYVNNAISYLKMAQKHIVDATRVNGETQEEFQQRKFFAEKAQDLIYKAEQTIKFGEIPIHKTSADEKKDIYNRVISAKKSLDQALTDLKLKEPNIKKAIQIVQQVKDSIRPYLKYQTINRADIFLTVYTLKHLDQATMKDKDDLNEARNVQNAILSIVYAQDFLNDAGNDLQQILGK